MSELNPRQLIFVNEYMKIRNATLAAVKAGYSKATAGQIGGRLLKNVKIQTEIKRRLAGVQKRTKITHEKIVLEIANVAFADLGLVCEWNETQGLILKDSKNLPLEQRKAIQAIKTTPGEHGTAIQFKMHDKLKALELLMKHYGMLDGQGSDKADRKSIQDRLRKALSGLAGE